MRFKHSLPWIAGIAVVVMFMFFMGMEEIKAAVKQIDPFIIVFLCFLQVLTLTLGAYKWRYLLIKLGKRLSLGSVFAVYMAGNFIESVTPSVKLGGEAAKLYLFRRRTSLTYPQLAGALLTHKYVSLLPFVTLCGAFTALAAYRYELPAVVFLALLLLGAVFTAVALLFKGRFHVNGDSLLSPPGNPGPKTAAKPVWEKVLNKAFQALVFINDSARHSRQLTSPGERKLLFGISLLVWALYPFKIYLVARSLGYETDIITAAVVTFTAYLVSMLPLLPGGLGTFEGSMAFMFSLGGLSPAEGLAVAVMSRLVTYWFPLAISAAAAGFLFMERHFVPVGTSTYAGSKGGH